MRLEIGLQFLNVLRKVVRSRGDVAPKGASSGLICPRSAAKSEIDTVWVERSERPELFGDDERRMIRQHDAAGADTDGLGASSDVADDDRRGCAGDAGHVVMFGFGWQNITSDVAALAMPGML